MSLLEIQKRLKVPKNQRNEFGGFNYRSQEDILEALKPLLFEYKYELILSDKLCGEDGWYYICSTATLKNEEGAIIAQTDGLAREAETRKGMDASQITGCASSYAGKRALGSMFLIADERDADYEIPSDKNKVPPDKKKQGPFPQAPVKTKETRQEPGKADKTEDKITPNQMKALRSIMARSGLNCFEKEWKHHLKECGVIGEIDGRLSLKSLSKKDTTVLIGQSTNLLPELCLQQHMDAGLKDSFTAVDKKDKIKILNGLVPHIKDIGKDKIIYDDTYPEEQLIQIFSLVIKTLRNEATNAMADLTEDGTLTTDQAVAQMKDMGMEPKVVQVVNLDKSKSKQQKKAAPKAPKKSYY